MTEPRRYRSSEVMKRGRDMLLFSRGYIMNVCKVGLQFCDDHELMAGAVR